jgi:hypothetical protein
VVTLCEERYAAGLTALLILFPDQHHRGPVAARLPGPVGGNT